MSQLPLPLSLHQVDRYVLTPALELLPARMDGPQARVMLLATGLQEARFAHRRQIRGPARGLWQFEDGPRSALAGLLTLPTTEGHMRSLCAARNVDPDRTAIYRQLEHDDVLAAGVARLLLWSDPKPLPPVPDASAGWALYLRTWRPGKPHPGTWPALYARAVAAVAPPDFSRVTGSMESTAPRASREGA